MWQYNLYIDTKWENVSWFIKFFCIIDWANKSCAYLHDFKNWNFKAWSMLSCLIGIWGVPCVRAKLCFKWHWLPVQVLTSVSLWFLGLNSLQSGLHKQYMKDLFVELCLTVPVRLSSLLPYLPMLMDPLVSALNGSQTLISQVIWASSAGFASAWLLRAVVIGRTKY